MTDAAPREGWYVVTTAQGMATMLRRTGDLWSGRSEWQDLVRPTLPPGWTLVARIDDLLRDAARYRWLRQLYYAGENEAGESTYLWPGTEHHVRHTAEIFGKRIDAEIARERGNG